MKRLFVLFVLTTLMLSAVPVSAMENAVLPAFGVYFNGNKVESEFREYPLLVYKDITYFPMTYFDSRHLGLTTEWDNDTRTLYIEKSGITCAYRDYKWQWENSKNNGVAVCEFNIVVNGETIDNAKEEYPLLTFGDVTYFPLTWRFAVNAFGWEYSFDAENGLSITSANYHVDSIQLPYITGDVATDGMYYFYSGEKDGKQVVLRMPVADTENPEIILELPDSPLTRGASFINACGEIYITYFAGYSGITGTRSYYKINPDGSVVKEIPDDKYAYGKHGSSELRVAKDGIRVRGIHEFIDGPTEFYYEIDGVTYEAQKLPGRVRVGRIRNGVSLYPQDDECVQIFDGKIYYTARDLDVMEDTSLYCIDTKTGENKKILDGVCGFYVYKGWLAEENADSTMILYDKDGYLCRYSEQNGETREIEHQNNKEQGLILEAATGRYTIYTVQKTIGGDRTVIKCFNGYADGNSMRTVVLETKTGTDISKTDDKLCIRIVGEAPEDTGRLMVARDYLTSFMSADAADSVFIYDNILLYKIGKDTVARVDLK